MLIINRIMVSSIYFATCKAFFIGRPLSYSICKNGKYMCNPLHNPLHNSIHNPINNPIHNSNNHYSSSANISWKSYFDDISQPQPPNNKQCKKKKNKYFPRTDNQRAYVEALEDYFSPLIFGLGPAGTGKTLFACEVGIRALKMKQFDKIVITRPLVSVQQESVGYLPGNMKDKMDPWTRPIIDVLCEILSKEDVENMIKSGIIEISPLGYMRGRTFKNAWIIADEMQNSSPIQMKMLTTRIGDGSKMVINGDLQQSDFCGSNGLDDILKRVRDFEGFEGFEDNQHTNNTNNTDDTYDNIRIVEMQNYDIQRSPIVAKLMKIYDEDFFFHQEKIIDTVIDDVVVDDEMKPKNKNQDAALMPPGHLTRNMEPPN